METNKVTSLYIFMLDDNGDELHGVVPKKLIWKSDLLLHVGRIYSLRRFTILGEKKIFTQLIMNIAYSSTGLQR